MSGIMIAFTVVSSTFSLPPGLLQSICLVESGHNPHAIHYSDGGANSVGICQIKLETAKLVGYKGTEAALRSDYLLNIYYSGAYLKKQLNRYNGDVRKAVAAYNAGRCKLMSNGIIKNTRYVNKVYYAWSGAAHDNN